MKSPRIMQTLSSSFASLSLIAAPVALSFPQPVFAQTVIDSSGHQYRIDNVEVLDSNSNTMMITYTFIRNPNVFAPRIYGQSDTSSILARCNNMIYSTNGGKNWNKATEGTVYRDLIESACR